MSASVSLTPCPTPATITQEGPGRLTLIVFSGELDRLQAAFTLATGAAACGIDVMMFFTFWGTALLRTGHAPARKPLLDRLFGWLMPRGPEGARLSRLDMAGIGRALMQHQMRSKGIPSLPELLAVARESGISFGVCESTMTMMGIDRSELMSGVEYEMCGVAHIWDQSAGGHVIFI